MRATLTQMPGAQFTHPDYASLVDPLFAFGGKRVKNNFFN
jgi:hypothetical protein